MIETANAIYLHIPKTAGTWVRNVLEPVKVKWIEHGILFEPQTKPVFAFVRNPWDWHVSFYHFSQQGSEYFQHINNRPHPIAQTLPKGHTFADFINFVCNPTAEYKRKLLSIHKLRSKIYNKNDEESVAEGHIFQTWIDADVGLYQHICNTYTKYADKIGKHETVREDLLEFTQQVSDCTDVIADRISSTPPMNITAINQDRNSFYNTELDALIYNSCSDIITTYGYTK